MRLFNAYRSMSVERQEKGLANHSEKPQFQGVVFDDGSVTVRWMTSVRSTHHYGSYRDFARIMGGTGTRVEFVEAQRGQVLVVDIGDSVVGLHDWADELSPDF